jgi:hypothetical protein
VKRSRQDDETQYQYRKRKAEQERLQTPEETQQPEARMEKAVQAMSFAFVSEDISPDTSLSLKSVAHLKNKKNP